MEKGLSLQEVLAMGGQPSQPKQPSQGGALTLEQVMSMGGKPVNESQAQETGVGRKIFDFFTSGTQAVGRTIGQSISASGVSESLSQVDEQGQQQALALQKMIRENKTSGKSTSRLEDALFDLQSKNESAPTLATVAPETQKSNWQAIGDIGLMALETLSGGTMSSLGKGAIKKTAAELLAAKAASRALPLGSQLKQIGVSTAKDLAKVVPFGYAADVSSGLSQGETGGEALKPGIGTALSVAIPGVIGATQATRRVLGKTLPTVASNLSGVETGAYKQVSESGRDLIGKVDSPSVFKDTRASLKAFDTAAKEEWKGATESLVKEFTGKRIGLGDKESNMLTKIAERFGFVDQVPQNLKSMSPKETIDLLTHINSIPPVTSIDDPLIKSLKINLGDVKDYIRNEARTVFSNDSVKFDNMYSNYSKKMGVINNMSDIVGSISASKKLTPTALQTKKGRLMSVFEEGKDEYLNVIKSFEEETGERILDKIAAAQLSESLPATLRRGRTPFGQGGFWSDVISAITLPLSSPKYGSWLIDKLAGNNPGIGSKILNANPKVREAIYNAVVKENMSFDDAVRLYGRDIVDTYKTSNTQSGAINLGADVGKVETKLKKIYHGTNDVFDNFDVKETADGGIWFTDNVDSIKKGTSGAAGTDRIMERFIDENNLKLGGWKEQDMLTTDEMIRDGFDGLKLEENGENVYKIFNPEKLSKTVQNTSDSILQEAKKYKSAEEFVKAQGEILYHGSPDGIINKIDATKLKPNGELGSGFYLSESPKMAGNYIKGTGAVNEINIGGLKILNTSKSGLDGFVDNAIKFGSKEKYIQSLKDEGYDGVRAMDKGEVVIFPESVSKIKTKSQLTEIWNKANNKTAK